MYLICMYLLHQLLEGSNLVLTYYVLANLAREQGSRLETGRKRYVIEGGGRGGAPGP